MKKNKKIYKVWFTNPDTNERVDFESEKDCCYSCLGEKEFGYGLDDCCCCVHSGGKHNANL